VETFEYVEGFLAAKNDLMYGSNPYQDPVKKLSWSKGHNDFRVKQKTTKSKKIAK